MRVVFIKGVVSFLAVLLSFGVAQETFRIAIGVDADTLDPVQGTTTTVDNIVDYMAQTLIGIDESGGLVPLLATEWETAEDGLSMNITLRDGVTFHDGTELTSEVVAWNIERLIDPNVRVPRRGAYTAIEGVEIVDDLHLRILLSEPAPYLAGALTQTTAALISPDSVEAQGNSYENVTRPVGTGPYVFESRSFGERIVVNRFDDYWGELPYYEQVIFQIVPEATTRESLILSGQVDMIILPPASDIPALQANPAVEVVMGPSDRTIFIVINTTDPALDDPRVRQALNYAVDKQAIVDGILFGAATVMDAPMAESIFGYEPIGTYEYDPERARELLAEAGVEEGSLTLDFMSPTGRYVQDFPASQAIASYLDDVGINAQVRTMDWPTYIGTMTQPVEQNETQLHLLGWAPAFLDASQQMQQFHSSQHPPAGLATSFYHNAEVDRLIDEANAEVDPERRQELYAQASRIIWDEAPWIFLWVQSFPMVHSADVTNISGLPNEKFYAIYARPAE
ncbi:MAG TPA: ABC transporter substrate-binding protein [Trueperaceae bacterium]